MHALAVSSLVFALVFGGAFVGRAIRRVRPDDHFSPEAKETIRVAIGLVVTMTSLVLGMLVSSSKTFYDGEKNQVAELAAQVILLNDLLASYGPEAGKIRLDARQFVEDAVNRIWPSIRSQTSQLRPATADSYFYQQIQQLTPKSDAQASAKAQILAVTLSVKKTYWLMYLQSEQPSLAPPLLVVVTSWLVAIFISFGVFAPHNSTVTFTLFVCAVAVSAAIFIISSMNSPFSGVLKISPAAVRDALSQMPAGQ